MLGMEESAISHVNITNFIVPIDLFVCVTLHLFSWSFYPKPLTITSAYNHEDTTQKLQETCKYSIYISSYKQTAFSAL